MKICPEHGRKLIGKHTKYGRRYSCSARGCTVACWDGDTSTPADQETRDARTATHAIFDPLWKDGHYPRHGLYCKLADALGIPKKQAHIGMMDITQCLRTQAVARALIDELEVKQ